MERKRTRGLVIVSILMFAYTAYLFVLSEIMPFSGGEKTFFYIIGIVYFITAIGMLRFKRWARVLSIVVSGALGAICLFAFFGAICMLQMEPQPGPFGGLIILTLIYTAGILSPNVILVYLLTHPKIKERFKG